MNNPSVKVVSKEKDVGLSSADERDGEREEKKRREFCCTSECLTAPENRPSRRVVPRRRPRREEGGGGELQSERGWLGVSLEQRQACFETGEIAKGKGSNAFAPTTRGRREGPRSENFGLGDGKRRVWSRGGF